MRSTLRRFIIGALCCVSLIPYSHGVDPRGLEAALLGYKWSWTHNQPEEAKVPLHKDKVVSFYKDGTALSTLGETWHWKIVGERSVQIVFQTGGHVTLELDAAFMQKVGGDSDYARNMLHLVRLGPIGNEPSAPAAAPPSIQTDASQARIEVLKEQAPNAVEWALAPLDQMVPGDIRQNLTFLREALLDEGKQKPKANPAAYALGAQICNTVLAAFEERNQTLVRAGFRAVEAQAQTGVSSQALEARRNYKMSWPQFAREQAQRAELKSQAVNGAAVMAERPKVEWTERTALYRKTLDTLYTQFREALRQGPAVK